MKEAPSSISAYHRNAEGRYTASSIHPPMPQNRPAATSPYGSFQNNSALTLSQPSEPPKRKWNPRAGLYSVLNGTKEPSQSQVRHRPTPQVIVIEDDDEDNDPITTFSGY